MIEKLADAPRMLAEAGLRPVQGDRFQPTGFAELGAATYELADGTRKLLVESSQSMANRLESAVMTPDGEIIPELEGLSYVRAKLQGDADVKTTTLLEAHRLNSPYIISHKDFHDRFVEEAGYSRTGLIDWARLAKTLFRYDVNSLLHGIFLSNVEDGRMRIPRAVSAFIEATDVNEAVSGGVKNNPLDPQGNLRTETQKKNVYGNVPYTRTEYTAGDIRAFFNIDLARLRSYDLGDSATDLLVNLALLKIRRFLNTGLRLRTACDLRLADDINVTAPGGMSIPSEEALLEKVREGIAACADMFAKPQVTELDVDVVLKKS
jgi:CRISPR-associated protein Csb1